MKPSNILFGIFWGALGSSIFWSIPVFGSYTWNLLPGIIYIIINVATLFVYFMNDCD